MSQRLERLEALLKASNAPSASQSSLTYLAGLSPPLTQSEDTISSLQFAPAAATFNQTDSNQAHAPPSEVLSPSTQDVRVLLLQTQQV